MQSGWQPGSALIGIMKAQKNRIHIIQLLSELPKMNFSSKQKELLLSQIVDNIEAFGTPLVSAENLSYLLHCLFRPVQEKITSNRSDDMANAVFNVDWRHQNQLML